MSSVMKKYLSFVKFEHTLFSLPLVAAGAVMAAGGAPDGRISALIIVAAAGARTAAMAINRIVDATVDAANPRTKDREIPAGRISGREAFTVAGAGLAAYFGAAYLICPLVFMLSPLPVAVFAAYPYMKRFTPLCHLGVGLALALAPAGGWLAVRCAADEIFAPLMLGLFTFLWVAGFDIIYSAADEDFDRANGLHSAAVSLGARRARRVSAALHAGAAVPLAALQIREFGGNLFSLAALAAVCAVLFARSRKADDTGLAFFKPNAVCGALVLVFILCGIYLRAEWKL